jgi:hypothetical protein
MRLTFVLFLFVALFSASLGSYAEGDEKEALIQACKELGGGTKVRLEFDLGGACHGPCKGGKKKKKRAFAAEA